MAKTETCYTCVYARWDPGLWLRTLWSGFPARATCGNQPDYPGRMRECLPQENACNQSKKCGAFSRFRDVSLYEHRGKYGADVYHKDERFFCGYFTDDLEAARARDYKAAQVLGEDARLNLPEEWPRSGATAAWQARRYWTPPIFQAAVRQ